MCLMDTDAHNNGCWKPTEPEGREQRLIPSQFHGGSKTSVLAKRVFAVDW